MADKNYTTKISLDVSQFKKEIRNVNQDIKLADSNFKLVSASSTNWKTNIQDLKNILSAQSKVVNENAKKTQLLKERYEALKNSNLASVSAIKSAEEAFIKQSAKTEEAKRSLEKYQKALSIDVEPLRRGLNSLNLVVSQLMVNFARDTVRVFANSLKEAVNTGLQFESAFAGVRKSVSGTKEEIESLKNEIIAISKEKPITASQIANIYQMGAQLGIQKENLKSFANTITDISSITSLTIEEAGTMMAQYANIMHMSSENFERFGSSLVKLGNSAATNENTIMEFASRLAGTSYQIGLTNQQVLALATSLGSVGLSAEMGGSAISTILSKIDKDVALNSKTVKTWAEVAGMSAKDFRLAWSNNVMGTIQKVIFGLSNVKGEGGNLSVILDELNIKNIRQADTMKRLASASEMLANSVKLSNSAWDENTALSEKAGLRYDTLEAQLQLLRNSVNETFINMYDSIKEPLKDIAAELNRFIQSKDFKKFINDIGIFITNTLNKGVSVLKNIIRNSEMLAKVLKVIGVLLAEIFVIPKILTFTKLFIGLRNTVIKLSAATNGATIAQKLFNAAMASNPVGAILTALSLLIGTFVILSGKMKENTDNAKELIKSVNDQCKAYRDLRDEQKRLIEQESEEVLSIQKRIDKLREMVDENGRVKDSYKDQIDFISNEYRELTGKEIRMVDGVILEYKELENQLDQVIKKKRIAALMDAYKDSYSEALKNEIDLVKKREELENVIKENQNIVDSYDGLSWEQEDGGLFDAKKKIEDAKKSIKELNKTLDDGSKTIKEYEMLEKAYNSNSDLYKTQTIGKIKYGIQFQSDNASKRDLQMQYENALQNLKDFETKHAGEIGSTYHKILLEKVEIANKARLEITDKAIEKEELAYRESLNKTKTNVENNISTINDNIVLKNNKTIKDTTESVVEAVDITTEKINNAVKKTTEATKDNITDVKQNIIGLSDVVDDIDELYDEDTELNNTNKKSNVIYKAGAYKDNPIEFGNVGKDYVSKFLSGIKTNKSKIIEEVRVIAQEQARVENESYAQELINPNNLEQINIASQTIGKTKQSGIAEGIISNEYIIDNAVVSALNQAKNIANSIDFISVGANIVNGILKGIQDNKNKVISAVRDMMKEAQEVSEDVNDIHSPTKVYYKYGKFIDFGFANGIRDYSNKVKNEMQQLSMMAQNTIDSTNKNINYQKNGAYQNLNNKSSIINNNYNITQNNTSPIALDRLAIYRQTKSLLKIATV